MARGIRRGLDFAILTDEITKAWSDKSVKEYKKFKNLKKQNLRDNISNFELVLNMLAEALTTEISKKYTPKGLPENEKIAKKTRKKPEKDIGERIISKKNSKYLQSKNEKN